MHVDTNGAAGPQPAGKACGRGDGLPWVCEWARLAAAEIDSFSWERCAREIAGRYRVGVDRAGRTGTVRYVAVARNVHVRPYAVVTSDPAELLAALGCADVAAAAGRHEAVR